MVLPKVEGEDLKLIRDAEKIVRLAQEEADRLRSTIKEETEKIRKDVED